MILTVDIGNMNMRIGGFEDGKLRFTSRCASDRNRTEDEYFLLFRDILGMYDIRADEIEGGILSSVVPSLRTVVCTALERLTHQRVLVVGPGLKNGLNIRIDDPSQLGGDLVVNAVAALAKYPKPIAIFDLETATTMSVISSDGAYLGGALIPGVRVSIDAMSASAAQLPYITLVSPDKLICSSTVSCMQSGAVYGCAAMVDGLSARAEEELGQPVTVVLTGSYSALIAPYCRRPIQLDETLQMEGLRLLYEKNQQRRKKK
jgi:type III pantothenate kinase